MTVYEIPTVSQALPLILSDLLEYGDEVGSRNGRVKELLNAQIVITDPTRREVLSLNRKANVFAQIAETMWVLAGRNDIEWLSAYLPRAVDYSDDGKTWRAGYGPRIRSWATDLGQHGDGNVQEVDQLAYVVDTLKADPLSRQAVVQIWDAEIDTTPGKDRACNTQLQFQSRNGKLHLTVTVRSNDVMWGWSGINAFEWSTVQEIVASLLGIQVGPLTFNIGSLHLYGQHWGKAESIEYLQEPQYPVVRFNPYGRISSLAEVDRLIERWFVWEEMCRTGVATPDLLEDWEEPLFKSWAAAIAYYWMRDEVWMTGLTGTALAVAIARTPASVLPEPVQRSQNGPVGVSPSSGLNEPVRAFYEFARDLHAKKDASYGDSWKKRGEKMSILANIARKVDRLGVGDEFDSAADTWIDLMIYLAKYLCWLDGKSADPDNVNLRLGWALGETENAELDVSDLAWATQDIAHDFDYYADVVDSLGENVKRDKVRVLLLRTAPIARDMWLAENDYRGADLD